MQFSRGDNVQEVAGIENRRAYLTLAMYPIHRLQVVTRGF